MLTKLNKKRDEKGFTLIELMIVIAMVCASDYSAAL
jgi:prepilin-type N-terminal cleavage/methylation domain-containing protein